ncbi:MAG: hypothetical protein R3A51_08115 [Nannocystaceae bacterium]
MARSARRRNQSRRARVVALLIIVLTAALASSPALACLWDRDTLAAESRVAPGAVEAITGRFERNPPEYYELRRDRLMRRWLATPQRFTLEEFDDVAVASDHLGRSEEAVEWMERKRTRLLAHPTAEHEYRFHANLGTFLAHRWLRAGARRDDLQWLQAARGHIQAAIDQNPDAHFGRERYQLLAIDWLLAPPRPAMEELPTIFAALPEVRDDPTALVSALRADANDDAIVGLAGLVVLGAAWESIDIHNSLRAALAAHGHGSLAILAGYRVDELVGAGARSLHPAAKDPPEALAKALAWAVPNAARPEHIDDYPRYYAAARREAEQWQAERWAYMRARFAEGRHPDTDDSFWRAFKPTTWPPRLPGERGDRASWRRILEPAPPAPWYRDLPKGAWFALIALIGGVCLVGLRRYT